MRLPQDYLPMDGKEVRRIRRGLHFTQVKFGNVVGVTGNTVARWERNEVRVPPPTAKLIQLLGNNAWTTALRGPSRRPKGDSREGK